MPSAFIAGIDSAIGRQLAEDLNDLNWRVLGSSRRKDSLATGNIFMCDFSNQNSVDSCVNEVCDEIPRIDLLVLSVGVLQPIGILGKTKFSDWERGFTINFTNPMMFIDGLLKHSILGENSMVLTFAGGGINSAPTNYSSYTISKVALTKSMEILAAEYPNIKFVSLGTGWINSPIHNQTLIAGAEAGQNYEELSRRLAENDFQPIETVFKFVLWAYRQNIKSVSGRNFSLARDPWGEATLISELEKDLNKFKLRRFGNE